MPPTYESQEDAERGRRAASEEKEPWLKKVNKVNDAAEAVKKGFNREVSPGSSKDLTTGEKVGYVAGSALRGATEGGAAIGRGAATTGRVGMAAGRAIGGAGKDAYNKFNQWRAGSPSGKGGKAAGAISNTGKSVANAVSGVGKKITGQGQGKNEGGPAGLPGANKGGTGPAALGGAMGAPKDSGAKQTGSEVGKRAIGLALSIPDIVIMLPIAVVLDFMGIIAAILSFFGIGFGLQYVVSIGGNIVIGFWIIVRSFFKSIVRKVISTIENMVDKEGSSFGQKPGGGAGKQGIKAGLSIARWLGLGVIKMIPFIGNFVPSFTITVIYEMLQEQI